ncbi:hypothetical protein E2I00_000406, partial [Balaenoptera physalus]
MVFIKALPNSIMLVNLDNVAMFVLQLGSATFLLTEPVISAMTTGAATHVIYAYVFENIKSVRLEALLLSLLSIVVLVLVKELNEQFKRKIKIVLPVDLVLIIAASFTCYCTNMENTYGLEVVGHIPKGIPPPRAPPMNILSAVITEAFGVALVGYVASLALAQGSAKKFKYSVDDNQEFLAHGLSNVIPSFFFCIPSAAAMGRTAVLYSTGAKTQVACLISCIFILIVIYAIGPLLYWLPMCVLASIIVVGLKGMLIQFRDLKKYWNVDKLDWGIWVSTYIFTICFAANVGLLFGVVCTIAIVIGRFPRAKTLSIKNMKEMEFKVKTEMDDGRRWERNGRHKLNINSIIQWLLEVRESKPGKIVQLQENEIRGLCLKFGEIFHCQPILLKLEAPLKICGDIHGQYYDLLRLFEYGVFLPESNYLFLGDYSLETICLLLPYKTKYSENVFLLRGNHECASINRIYGFYDECKRRYNIKLWKTFTDCFNCLPIAAIMDEKIFCCHGDQGLLCDLLWSDPDKDVLGWVENDRGVSFTFGEVVAKFLHKYDLDLICRAYQVVEDGYKFFAKRQLVTLFSASNCCGGFDNAGAMMSETLQQVKIISINNPLVFLNVKKFHADLMNIIQKENTSNQPLDEIS